MSNLLPVPGFRPEALLLLAACSPNGNGLTPHNLSSLDEEWLRTLMARHRLVPQLHSFLEQRPQIVSDKFRDGLASAHQGESCVSLELAAELARISDRLREQGIRNLTCRGPTLTLELYGDLAARHFRDIDIFMDISDVRRAREIMEADGYVTEVPLESDDALQTYLDTDCELNFDHGNRRIHVELHWEFLETVVRFRCRGEFMWQDTREMLLANTVVTVPGREQLFVSICIHGGYKHRWERLKWLADVAHFIHRYPDLDWDRVVELTHELGHGRELAEAALLSRAFFHVELPRQLEEHVRSTPMYLSFSGLVPGKMFREDGEFPGFREWRKYAEHCGVPPEKSGSLRWHWRYLRAVFTPTWADVRNYCLPEHGCFKRPWKRFRHLFSIHRGKLLARLR